MYVKSTCFFLIILSGYLMPLNAQQYVQPQQMPQQYGYQQQYAYPVPPSYYGTQSEYYYNQNNPYTNTQQPPGFYGGFYGSAPPPTPAQAFPDKAAADNLYRYIQNR
jgi:hypothetical protein